MQYQYQTSFLPCVIPTIYFSSPKDMQMSVVDGRRDAMRSCLVAVGVMISDIVCARCWSLQIDVIGNWKVPRLG